MVPEMQKRLAEKANELPEHRFGNLYDLLMREDVLDRAATRLLGNKGSRTPGLDGLDRDKLNRNRGYHLATLKQQLRDGTFQPTPVKRVHIPKKNGKLRPLGIPTLYDRWVQMAVKMVIEPIFESDFAEYSHGFRPQRSCHTAIAHVHRLTIQERRKVYWVIEGDIEGFFDHVHHKKLMTLLRKRIQDKRLLDLIWQFLKAGVMEGQLFVKTEEGTPQGGVLSPLLANIYLNHFDQWFAKRSGVGEHPSKRMRNRQAGHANFMMVRYADDFVVFSNGSKEETDAFKAELKTWLAEELKLTLSEEKTAVTHYTDGFDFLGFTLKKTLSREGKIAVVHYPSTASVQRAVRRVEDLTSRNTARHNPIDQIEALNSFLRGWGEYFRHSCAKNALRYVGSRAHMRMWKWLKVKSELRHGWREVKAKYNRDNTWQVDGAKLFVLQTMPVEYPFHKKIGNPYLAAKPVTEPKHRDPHESNSWKGEVLYGDDWAKARTEALAKWGGKCCRCGSSEGVEVHHITARRKRGGNVATNLAPLCRPCHREAEKRNSKLSHELRGTIRLVSGEPCALKGASTVRGETL
jgi:RNA-directed DNA polymerase